MLTRVGESITELTHMAVGRRFGSSPPGSLHRAAHHRAAGFPQSQGPKGGRPRQTPWCPSQRNHTSDIASLPSCPVGHTESPVRCGRGRRRVWLARCGLIEAHLVGWRPLLGLELGLSDCMCSFYVCPERIGGKVSKKQSRGFPPQHWWPSPGTQPPEARAICLG